MKVEVAVLGSPSLMVLVVFVDVKQKLKKNLKSFARSPPSHYLRNWYFAYILLSLVHSYLPIFTWNLGSLRFSNFQLEIWIPWIFQMLGSQLFSDFYVEIWVSWVFAVS